MSFDNVAGNKRVENGFLDEALGIEGQENEEKPNTKLEDIAHLWVHSKNK